MDLEGLKVCIVGYGSIGRRHAANALELGAKVCFLRTGQAVDGRPRLDTEVDEFFDRNEVLATAPDVVIVANPTDRHLDTALWAVEAGCDVLVEKPLAHETASLPRLLSAVRSSGVVAGVAHQMRFDQRLRRLRALVDDRTLGDVRSAHVEWGTHLPSWHPWEDYRSGYAARRDQGGGVILTCCHELNTIEYLMGPVVSATAAVSPVDSLELDADGCVDAMLTHQSGATSLVHLDFFQRPNRRRIRLIGERGSAEWDFDSPALTVIVDGESGPDVSPAGSYPYEEDYRTMLVDFGAAVRRRSQPRVPLEEGARTVAVATAMQKSAANGSSAIAVEEIA